MVAELLTGGVTLILGVGLVVLGFGAIEAGKGGYGRGPIPFLKVPRDNLLLAGGIFLYMIGTILVFAAIEVIR